MIHFHGIFHREFELSYVGEFLEFKILDFRGLKGQFDVKKANFRELIAKTVHYRHILASITHLWPIFLDYSMGTVTYGMLEGFYSS